MSRLTLLVGGARAGKSSLAERMALASGMPVTFIATATADDDDMRRRIARHRAERPADWVTVEEPRDLAAALGTAAAGHVVIVDCLTLWTTNMVLAGHDDAAVAVAAGAAVRAAASRAAPVVVVTNEVGLGVVPASALGRTYRDTHGMVNRQWSRAADAAYLVVAGRAMPLPPCDEVPGL